MFDSCSKTTHWTRTITLTWNQIPEITPQSGEAWKANAYCIATLAMLSLCCIDHVASRDCEQLKRLWTLPQDSMFMQRRVLWPFVACVIFKSCCATDAMHCICELCGKSARAEKRARDVAAMSVFVSQNGMNSTRCVEIECTIKPQCNTIFE